MAYVYVWPCQSAEKGDLCAQLIPKIIEKEV